MLIDLRTFQMFVCGCCFMLCCFCLCQFVSVGVIRPQKYHSVVSHLSDKNTSYIRQYIIKHKLNSLKFNTSKDKFFIVIHLE